MNTLILKWSDAETSVTAGKLFGATSEEDGVATTVPKLGDLNLCRVGSHSYISDNSDPENPVITQVPGWFVIAGVPPSYDLEGAMGKLPEGLQPEILWDSSATTEEGDPIPRPPISEAPQHRWA